VDQATFDPDDDGDAEDGDFPFDWPDLLSDFLSDEDFSPDEPPDSAEALLPADSLLDDELSDEELSDEEPSDPPAFSLLPAAPAATALSRLSVR
jgi:hypothetical protein